MSFLDNEAVETRRDNEYDGYSSEEIAIVSSRKRPQELSSESVSESEEEKKCSGRGSGKTATARLLTGLKDKKKQGGKDDEVMCELKEMNKILLSLSERMKKTEKRMKTMEEKITSTSPSSSSCVTPKSSRKKDVPQEVRVSFTGWYVHVTLILLYMNQMYFYK